MNPGHRRCAPWGQVAQMNSRKCLLSDGYLNPIHETCPAIDAALQESWLPRRSRNCDGVPPV